MTRTAHRIGTGVDPVPMRWTYDLATLAGVGVSLEPEQAELLDPDTSAVDVVVACAMPDPLMNIDGLRHNSELPPMRTFTPGGHVRSVVVPVIGRLDYALEAHGEEPQRWFHTEEWWRFPSVPVRLALPSMLDEPEEVARCVRVWNAWPLPPSDGPHEPGDDGPGDSIGWSMQNMSDKLYYSGWYAKCRDYAEWRLDKLSACALADLDEDGPAHLDGSPPAHQHTTTGDCVDGLVAAQRLERELFLDATIGWWRHPDINIVFTDLEAGALWHRLTASSQRNSAASLGVVPEWERRRLADSEGRYSPWVLYS